MEEVTYTAAHTLVLLGICGTSMAVMSVFAAAAAMLSSKISNREREEGKFWYFDTDSGEYIDLDG
jgi:hypothetical protein